MAFSEPGEGIHSLRVFNIAIVDVFFTVLAALVISRTHFLAVFTVLIIISIILHTVLGIKTKTNSWLFAEQ